MIVLIVLLLLCVICVLSCHWPLGLLFSKGGHELCNVGNNFKASCALEFETATDDSAQALEELINGP